MSIQTSMSNEGLQYQLSIAVPTEALQSRYQERLNQLAKQIRLKGFRPGKVPPSKVAQLYGDEIFGEIAADITQKSLSDALKENKLSLVNQPHVEFKSQTLGAPLEFTATFEIYPKVALQTLDSVLIKKPIAQLSDTDIKQAIEAAREEHPTWKKVERKSKKGDRVTIDFHGTIDDKPFRGGSSKGYTARIGHDALLPAFEKSLMGRKVSDSFSFECLFPENYHDQDLALKTANFAVTLHQIEAPTKLALGDEFIQHINSQASNVDELRQELIEPAQTRLDKLLIQITKQRAFEAASSKHDFEVPNFLAQNELDRLREKLPTKERIKRQSLTPQSSHKLVKQAKHNVRVSLVVRQLMLDNQIRLDNRRLAEYIRSLKMPYVDEETFINWFYKDPNRVEEAKGVVLEDQVVDFILSHAKIKEESFTLKEAEKRYHEEIEA